MDFYDAVRKRRMVRAFEQRPVARDILGRVLDAARRAPSAGYSQGFEFVVLQSPEERQLYWETTNHPDFPYEPEELASAPPVLVLPLADKAAYLERYSRPDKIAFGLDDESRWPVPYWYIDTAMAVMVMLLAAVSEELGGWFFGISHGEQPLLEQLGVPAAYKPIGVVGLGYAAPVETKVGSGKLLRRRPIDEIVHWGHW